MSQKEQLTKPPDALLIEPRRMIADAREQVAQVANAALTMLYWRIGKRIRHEVLGNKRADYGQQIVAALRRQLGWTHFKALIPLKDPLKRDFYAEMCRVERWSTRTLASKLDSMLYERTAISKKPEEVARAEIAALRSENSLSPDLVFRDPRLPRASRPLPRKRPRRRDPA